MTREEIYDSLYQKASNLEEKYDPCNISNGICQREKIKSGKSFCCGNCEYLTNTGCSVKALYCKLWICCSVEKLLPIIFWINRSRLLKKAVRYNLLFHRESKENTLKRIK